MCGSAAPTAPGSVTDREQRRLCERSAGASGCSVRALVLSPVCSAASSLSGWPPSLPMSAAPEQPCTRFPALQRCLRPACPATRAALHTAPAWACHGRRQHGLWPARPVVRAALHAAPARTEKGWACHGRQMHAALTCMQPLARHVRTSAGTTPSCVTRAAATNSPNARPRGDPCKQHRTPCHAGAL